MNAILFPGCTHVLVRDHDGMPRRFCNTPASYVPYYVSGRLATYYPRCRKHSNAQDRPFYGWGRGPGVDKLATHSLCVGRNMAAEGNDDNA